MHSVCVALERDIFGARVLIATLVESVLLINFLHLIWLDYKRRCKICFLSFNVAKFIGCASD